jgi:hypothetical protein
LPFSTSTVAVTTRAQEKVKKVQFEPQGGEESTKLMADGSAMEKEDVMEDPRPEDQPYRRTSEAHPKGKAKTKAKPAGSGTGQATGTAAQTEGSATAAGPPAVPSPPVTEGTTDPPSASSPRAVTEPRVTSSEEGEKNDAEVKLFDKDWTAAYEACPKFSGAWKATRTGPWPDGYRKEQGRLIRNSVWCLPLALTAQAIREQHQVAGHIGGKALLDQATKQFEFASEGKAKDLSERAISHCEYCQAAEHPHQPLRLRVVPTPVPPHIMQSVAIDLFTMPEVEVEGQVYNVFAACVDRHSGWGVVTAHHTRGLTAAAVAKAMYERWWAPHGLPSVITSDRGPHFAGAWWRAMCAKLGVRHAYSQAYHHAANGRAESFGAQLQKRLRKLKAEDGSITWVEALPRALRMLHDAIGQSGLSPYQILYGRDRWYAGVPYQPPTKAEDAVAFFERMEDIDKAVAEKLNEVHSQRAEQVNRRRRELPEFQVGAKVWYLRPRNRTGEKLETYWVGPCVIEDRTSEHGYTVRVAEGRTTEAHRSQLKEWRHDEELSGPALKLFHYKQAVPEEEATKVDEWVVEKVEAHRRRKEDGDLEFLVQWEGSPERTWEPLRHFFHRYAQPIVDYFQDKGLKEDIMAYLARHPTEAQVAICAAVDTEKKVETESGLRWEEPPEGWTWEGEEEMDTAEEHPGGDGGTGTSPSDCRQEVHPRYPVGAHRQRQPRQEAKATQGTPRAATIQAHPLESHPSPRTRLPWRGAAPSWWNGAPASPAPHHFAPQQGYPYPYPYPPAVLSYPLGWAPTGDFLRPAPRSQAGRGRRTHLSRWEATVQDTSIPPWGPGLCASWTHP